ncbi:hypothetical protein PHABIO_4 [Pseudomonas phage Phabio]|uniref:Uncharacterized protein n=1 Tax=Pseudomonas phage Phabio TaxID=2006668 RepID=A0A1Y0SVY3_9CAUD|nr:hypothetical protein MZD05_gp004 [Pseudomonas phage Phabio]ARV76635.1 hypothetical protein PHABIO_4 [Pseudomonas phage Phabio]
MKLFVAVEHGKDGERVQWSEDVNLIVFCAESIEDWPKVAELFNSLKLPARHHHLMVYTDSDWRIREIGETTLFTVPTIIEHAVADA